MKDIFLQSTDKATMLADLEALCPAFIHEEKDSEGNITKNFKQASHAFAIDYIGILAKPGTGKYTMEGVELEPVEYYDGVHCNLRVWGEHENVFDSFIAANTVVLNPSTPARVFG